MVITGVGVAAPNGVGKEKFWQANLRGVSGVSKIDDFDASLFDSQVYGKIRGFNPLDFIPRQTAKRVDRFVHLGLASCKMALEDSNIDLDKEDKDRMGVIIGSGLGGVIFYEEQIIAGYKKGMHRLNPLSVPRVSPGGVSSHIAIQYNILGPNMVISAACSSGTIAIGEALRKIQNQEIDLCITGGAEAPLTQFSFGAYDALKVLSKRNDNPQRASCPFDKERDGFVLSEGGAILILEDLEHALKRNAHIYAEVSGYACNSGAYHVVIPHPEASDAAKVMEKALKDADLKPEDVNYINAHGTSTIQNDKAETKAIKKVFSDYARRLPVSSTKSMIGHTIGAAGAIEAVVCSLAIENQAIPPTINYEHEDPDCDLDYVPNNYRKANVNVALSNSFGFGSINASLILRRYDG